MGAATLLRRATRWYLRRSHKVRFTLFLLGLTAIMLPLALHGEQTETGLTLPEASPYEAVPLDTYLLDSVEIVKAYRLGQGRYLIYTGSEYMLVVHLTSTKPRVGVVVPVSGSEDGITYNRTLLILPQKPPETFTIPDRYAPYLCGVADPSDRPPLQSLAEGLLPHAYYCLCHPP